MVSIGVFGAGAVVMGYLADTFGRKRVILLSVLGSATCNILSSWAPGYWTYVALYVAGGQ